MKMNDLFPSKYLKAEDITQPITVTIHMVTTEEVGQNKDQRAVVYFTGVSKGLILNKTCYIEIATWLNDEDTDHWHGQQVQLYRGLTMFQGKQTPCIRTRAVTAPVAAPVARPQGASPFAPLEPGQPDLMQGQPIPDPGQIRR